VYWGYGFSYLPPTADAIGGVLAFGTQ